MKYPLVDLDADAIGDVELADSVFALADIRGDILHRMVCYQLAGRRSGTRKTQTRSEVSVRKGKAHAQKRTGRARAGSRNSPLFVGGGVAHGPRVHSHATKLPKKIRALALRHALSSKVRDKALIVVSELASESNKTGVLRRKITALGADNALIVGDVDSNFRRAAANISTCHFLAPAGLNVYDILRRPRLVLTSAVIDGLHARFAAQAGC